MTIAINPTIPQVTYKRALLLKI